MPSFDDPAADAAEAQQALRGLAHATRSIDDPTQVYSVLESLSAAAASFEQSLHQPATFHDGTVRKGVWVTGDERAGRAAANQISWELHRAGAILRQVAASLDHAHEVEASIAYDHHDFPLMPTPPRPIFSGRRYWTPSTKGPPLTCCVPQHVLLRISQGTVCIYKRGATHGSG